MDGIINLYKERGFTSHDAVAKLRGIAKQKKIGHTGTLDPDAEGVLPVCLGYATKACGLLTDEDKTYKAVLLLGVTTDTQDMTGTVLERLPVTVDEQSVREAIMSFAGVSQQVPPMYSALKVNGKKLCDLARRGIEVERSPRQINIYGIDILGMALPEVTVRVRCSKGTYIRTLCHDIGQVIGCGGCMKSLVREAVGPFRIEDSITLKRLEELASRGELESALISADALFVRFPEVFASAADAARLYNGNPVRAAGPDGTVRMYDHNGVFMGIYEQDGRTGAYKPVKLMADTERLRRSLDL